jgi:hypothetical protein
MAALSSAKVPCEIYRDRKSRTDRKKKDADSNPTVNQQKKSRKVNQQKNYM